MKLTDTFDSMTNQLRFFKAATIFLSFLTFVLAAAVAGHRPEVKMIERTAQGLAFVKTMAPRRTEQDIRNAIELMVKSRFQSETPSPDLYLTFEQLQLRQTEQSNLTRQNLLQFVIIRKVTLGKDTSVEFDRVLSTGEIRSALSAKVRIAFAESEPNELNPYGLKLSTVEAIEKEEAKK